MWVLVGSFFTISNFYLLDLRNNTRSTVANLRWSIYDNQTSLDSVPVENQAKTIYIIFKFSQIAQIIIRYNKDQITN